MKLIINFKLLPTSVALARRPTEWRPVVNTNLRRSPMLGVFVNWLFTLIFAVVAVVAGIMVLYYIVTRNEEDDRGRRDPKGKTQTSLVFLAISAFFLACFLLVATHSVVQVNQRAVVLDTGTNARVVGGVRGPGLTSIPLFTGNVLIFHGGRDEPVTFKFTPSVKGGYEVAITTTFFCDLGQVNWAEQYTKFNGNYGVILEAWGSKLASRVAFAVKDFQPRDLTALRSEAEKLIYNSVSDWFQSEGIPLKSVAMPNWDFTNPKVAESYDSTIIAQTLSITAQAQYDAAEIQRKTETYQAETANQVLASRTAAIRSAMADLGIKSEGQVNKYLALQWLSTADPSQLRGVYLSLGGEQEPVPVQ